MKSFEDLINNGIDNKVAEFFPDLIIKKGMEFLSKNGVHYRVTGVSKKKKKVMLYNLERKFAFTVAYETLREALANPKVRIL